MFLQLDKNDRITGYSEMAAFPGGAQAEPPAGFEDGFWPGRWAYRNGVFEETGEPDPAIAQKENEARAERDGLLAACDWTQMPDCPLNDAQKAAWAAYRQALRDVPAQAGFPGAIDWPAQPGEAAGG